MHDTVESTRGGTFRHLLRILAACIFWIYAVLAAFLWYGARLVPESAVGIRILAGAVSDQVWLPPGMLIWYIAADWVMSLRRPAFEHGVWKRSILIVIIVLSGLVVLPELMFRLLFVPLLILVVRSLVRMQLFRQGRRALMTGLPFWGLIILTCVYYNWLLVPVNTAPVPAPDETAELSVLTYNIYRRARMDRRQQIIDTIRNADADIVCMVEVLFGHDEELFQRELGDRYPYMLTNQSLPGVRTNSMILSKYPVRTESPVFDDWSYGPLDFTFYTVTVNGTDIRMVSFHLQTVGHYFENIHRNDGAITDRYVESSEQESHIDRTKYAQVSRICEELADERQPVILLGDMNDTPNGRIYNLFRRSFDDAFAAVGWGRGTTFGRIWLLNKKRVREIPFSSLFARDFLRIDYVFTGGGVYPRTASVITSANGSDHRPVYATVEIPLSAPSN